MQAKQQGTFLISLTETDGDVKITWFEDEAQCHRFVRQHKLHKDDYSIITGTLSHHTGHVWGDTAQVFGDTTRF